MIIKQSETHLAVHNVYDTKQQLLGSTHFNQIQVNGITYNNLSELIEILTPLLFSKQELNNNGDANYVYTQNIPASVWTVVHTLNKKPSVTVTDSAGTIVEGQIEYISTSQLKITFTAAFSGTVILN
ncbi:hypothetical protein ACNQGL_07670 [Flavobacterium sp. LB3P21]|uniref:hypothetical protein n=1 Tax=Flavobacterium sp. LB3P21 TaxID=3401719 RepID=UPI003AAFC663